MGLSGIRKQKKVDTKTSSFEVFLWKESWTSEDDLHVITESIRMVPPPINGYNFIKVKNKLFRTTESLFRQKIFVAETLIFPQVLRPRRRKGQVMYL